VSVLLKLVLVVLLLIGLPALAVLSGRIKARNAIFLVVLVAGLPVLALLFFKTSTSNVSATIAVQEVNDRVASSHWMAAISEGVPSPHVSQKTLAPAVTNQVAGILEQVAGNSEIRVIGEDVGPTLAREVYERLLAARFSMLNPQDNPPASSARPPTQTWVTLRWQDRSESRAPWWPTPIVCATFVAQVDSPKGTALVQAQLDEKPWLDAAPFSDGGRRYIVARSPHAGATEADARQMAQAAAVDRLVPLVRERAAQLGNRSGSVPDSVVRKHATQAIASRRHTVDDCLVRVDRPFSPVYFAAEMLDVDPPMVDLVATNALRDVTRGRRGAAGMVGAIAGMVLVLAVVYGVLNALTRGYFRGHLRVAAVVALAAAVAVILLLLA
jgi:hypothetical protein